MLSKLRHTLGTGVATTQFFLYGKMHFTRTGYERHVKKYDSPVQSCAEICVGAEGADGVDLGGKTIVVTGYVSYLNRLSSLPFHHSNISHFSFHSLPFCV
jgi:hypothetical protein